MHPGVEKSTSDRSEERGRAAKRHLPLPGALAVEQVLFVSLVASWVVLLLNLMLTLRVVRWLRSVQEAQQLDAEREDLFELPLGKPAPGFRVKDLSGRTQRLENFTGRETVLVFVSPHCEPCRQEMPGLLRLGAGARERAGAEIALVSDAGIAETQAWVDKIRAEDKVNVDLTVLLAPRNTSEFLAVYNPRGITPYFCQMDEGGIVAARGPLGADAWRSMNKRWHERGSTTIATKAMGRRYR